MAEHFVTYAQNFEDIMLWRALQHVGRGFYIDVGACEPVADSVTLAFYQRGWRGINLEPAPGAFARLDAARPRDTNLQLAAGAGEAEAEFLLVDGGNGLSTLRTETRPALEADYPVEVTRVRVRRLADICREQGVSAIHFLKIDAEGAECHVLEGADLATWRPWIVVVEATAPNAPTPTHQQWEPVLLAQRYRMVYADGLNRFYLAEEQEALAPAFAVPPNVFDRFVRYVELEHIEHARAAAVEQAAAAQQQADAALAAARQHAQAEADARRAAQAAADTANQARTAAEQALSAAQAEAQAAAEQASAAGQAAARADAAAQTRIATLEAERDHAVQEMWESNRLAASLASDRQKLLDALNLEERDRAVVRNHELEAVYASTSWRASAPLRAASRTLQRFTKR